jgi:hypothetical protein
MSRAREVAERTARLAEHHIVEQEARIERQVSLVAKLERDAHIAMLKEAQRLLSEMIVLLVKMHDDLRQSHERFDYSLACDAEVTTPASAWQDGQNQTVHQ